MLSGHADRRDTDMKVLVATHESQGAHPDDYCATLEGELVTTLGSECCSPDMCGCGRGFPGLASSMATTTAMVADLPHMNPDTLAGAVRDSLERGGWLGYLDPAEQDELVADHLIEIREVCSAFPIGTIVCRSGSRVFPRPRAA